MSLNYNFADIKDWEKVVKIPVPENADPNQLRMSTTVWETEEGIPTHYMNPVTHVLIFGTMTVGMGKITEKNYKEFWMRMQFADVVFGPSLKSKGKGRGVTLQEVKQHIGLSTNVCNETGATFYKRMKQSVERRGSH